jgi:CAAX prenyl protease-like protein
LVAGLLVGAAIAWAWVPLGELVPPLTTTSRTGLDPETASPWLLACRVLAMTLVVPFAEELLVRSAIPRYVDARAGQDWRTVPFGKLTILSAAVSIAFFTLTHPEWSAALVAGVVWTALLAWTRNLRVLVLSHAVANAGLAARVLAGGDERWW